MKELISREEIRKILLAMLRSGTLKLEQADYAKDPNTEEGTREFVRTVCFNFDVLDQLEDLVFEYYSQRRIPCGCSPLPSRVCPIFFTAGLKYTKRTTTPQITVRPKRIGLNKTFL